MKKGILIIKLVCRIALVVAAAISVGCDKHENVVGQWQFTPELHPDSIAQDIASCLVMSSDGRVLLTTDVELVMPVDSAHGNFADSVSVKAVAAIEGTWSYAPHKNDIIDIKYDHSTFGVSIDPDDVRYLPIAGNRYMSVVHEAMKDATINEYREKLSPYIKEYFNGFSRISGIRVSNGMMYCECGDRSYVMRGI